MGRWGGGLAGCRCGDHEGGRGELGRDGEEASRAEGGEWGGDGARGRGAAEGDRLLGRGDVDAVGGGAQLPGGVCCGERSAGRHCRGTARRVSAAGRGENRGSGGSGNAIFGALAERGAAEAQTLAAHPVLELRGQDG